MITELRKDKDLTIVHLYARSIDINNSEDISEKLKLTIKKTSRIIVDLGDIQYIDSSGLRVILNFYHLTKKIGMQLCLVNKSSAVKALFDLVYLDKILYVSDSLENALRVSQKEYLEAV